MGVTLSANYLAELKKSNNSPNTIMELELDSGNVKHGLSKGGFNDVLPTIKSVPSLQNKLDIKKGYASKGSISFTIEGRDNFKDLIKDEYLKNRRVNRWDGFNGMLFSDYVKTFTGTIQNWSRNGNKLTITVADDTYKTIIKLPVENATKTQFINYMDVNPVDMMLDILKGASNLNIDASLVDTATFESERNTWLNAWKVGRILREPKMASDILNELQQQTNSYIIHDGQKVSYKVDAPPVPSQTIPLYTESQILDNSVTASSGYGEFYNNIVVYYDFDESSNDKEENYEEVVIVADADSQGSGQWDEIKTKVIKSKLFRTYKWTQPVDSTGITIFHVSNSNGLSAGKTGHTIAYTDSTNSVTWTAPDGTTGASVKLDKDGVYQVFDNNPNKSIRIIVDKSALPSSNKSDAIDIESLSGSVYATALAGKILQRYTNPPTIVSLDLDINNSTHSGELLKVSDTIDLQTDEAFDKGQSTWTQERMMVTSAKYDFSKNKISLQAVQTRSGTQSGLKYGYIAPPGQPDYPSATTLQRQYAYIGNASNLVNVGTEDGYYII